MGGGLLLVDKPAGLTSFDVVRRVRSLCRTRKVGHTGTLDPFATGVLPICVGSATRLAGLLTDGDKTYEATVALGVSTDTLDLDGRVVATRPVDPALTEAQFKRILAQFTGSIQQTPPMYSAVKIKGKRLYQYAREGRAVERPSREVTVHELTLLAWTPPRATIRVRCSKGTYVRVLAADIGEALGCGAHLVSLRRTRVGPFGIEGARTLEALERMADSGDLDGAMIPLVEVVPHLPRIQVSGAQVRRVKHGNPVSLQLDAQSDTPAPGDSVRLCHGARLLAVGVVSGLRATGSGRAWTVQPRIVFPDS